MKVMTVVVLVAIVSSLWVVTSAAMPPAGHGRMEDPQSPEAVEKWFKEHLPHAKEKLTRLHFYFHDNITATNPTAVEVARATANNITTNSTINFGATFVLDDPLTLQPEPNSKIIGRAQGVYSSVSQSEISLMLVLNLVFTHGKYKGSTLSLLGMDSILHQYREMPILGGTGVFRLARGIATAQTHTFNASTLNAIVEVDVMVLHYSV